MSDPIRTDCRLSRRNFLKLSGATALSMTLPATFPACAHRIDAGEARIAEMPVLRGWKPHAATAYIAREERQQAGPLFRKTIEASTDFSWLTPGDSVLIKIALNSANPYPATTDPWALHAMITMLSEKGAGRILVGDSSGVESVLWQEQNRKGSSRDNCRKAGLLQVIEQAGAEAVFFEEPGYESFLPMEPEGTHHWKEPIRITETVNEVDHIIYLTRVSAHVLSDITSGMKIGVGFLREDSRRAFHRGGDAFYSMYEEINRIPAIQSRLRLIVSSGTKVLATFGPDNGHVTSPDIGLYIASEDLFAHEILAYAWLLYNREFMLGFGDIGITGRLTRIRSFINRGFVWFVWRDGRFTQTPGIPLFIPGSIYAHPSIMNYMHRKGGLPGHIQWEQINSLQGSDRIAEYIHHTISAGRIAPPAG